LDEYELKNSKLVSDIDKASSVLKTTKEKYVKVKEKFNSLAKRYKKMNEEKLNKSDVQVGPDTSVDLSLVVEDLQRSKETAEETNLKLRAELDKLREEIGKSEYQMKAIRKANVVLMKQSRSLYQESEEHKRLDEERAQELQKHREMKQSLQEENDASQKERELLEKQVKELAEETAKLKCENDEYFLEKNRREIELEEKANECNLHSRQLEKLKHENEFLYQQGRKLQAELDVTRMKPFTGATGKHDEKRNSYYGFDNEFTKGKDTLTDLGSIKDFGTGRLSQASQLGESTSSLSFDEAKSFIPPVFNNEKIIGDKVRARLF
jgi:chromosome segregation ATPase